ncbi:MAG: hypothetical protein GY696_12205, partial [Gammaproteobacteria bacterium]|nr:hypothetical protein [Gammaproteobacteria bacterium]
TINGVSTAYEYDERDRLIKQGGVTYFYDNNGNLIREVEDGSITASYGYNQKNELIALDKNGQDTSYAYNPDGIRISQITAGITTSYLVDENRDYAQVLHETDGTNVVLYSYGDDLISQNRNGSTSYYHYDGLGSTRALSDTSGAVTDSYNYDAFGIELNRTGTTDNNYLFTGEQLDSQLGDYYLRARYYSPDEGRFTQMDSFQGVLTEPLTLHKYLYANADPVNSIDPSGKFGLVSFGVANNIRHTLTEMQVTVGTSILDAKLDPDNAATNVRNDILLGLASLGADASFKLLRLLSSKFRKACNSFSGDTLVSTEHGLKPISEIEIGEMVWAFDEEAGEKSLQEIVHTIAGEGEKEIIAITLASGEIIKATAGHPFYVDGKWIEAEDLTIDKDLLNIEGLFEDISSLDHTTQDALVYNLTVANDHTYFVGMDEVLSHNAGKCKIPVFDIRAVHHIRGEFNSDRKFIGYHSRFGGVDTTGVRVINIERDRGGNKNKIYRGIVQVEKKKGKWVNKKRKFSTFWPDGWDMRRIRTEVNAVYNKAVLGPDKVKGTGIIEMKGPSGFKVLIQTEGGKIIRTHPLF